MKIEKSIDYDKNIQRSGSVDAWLDENINHDLMPHLIKSLQAETKKDSDKIIRALVSYWAGVQDGHRFNRKSPYSEKNPPLENDNGSRVV